MKVAPRLTMERLIAIALLSCVPLVGCKSLFDPPLVGTRATIQAALLDAEASSYTVGSERAPKDTTDYSFDHAKTVPDSEAPTIITIATMTPSGSSPFPGRIVARITSNRDFAPMQIKAGKNYIWRDVTGVAWLTPASGSVSYKLHLVPNYIFPNLPPGHQPTLYRIHSNSLGFLACLDDCDSGHCGMY